MGGHENNDYGRQIGNTVKGALESGDLSRLKDIGPMVQGAIQKGIGGQPPSGQPGGYYQHPPAQPPPQYQPPPEPAPRPAWQGQATPQVSQRPKKIGRFFGFPFIITGILGLIAFGICVLILGVLASIFSTNIGLAITAGVLVAPFAVSGILLGLGIGRRGLAARANQFYALLMQKPVQTFEELTAATGRSPEKVKRDAKKAIEKNLLPGTRMDNQETCLIYGEEAYKQYLETETVRRQREQAAAEREKRMGNPDTAALEIFRSEGEEALKKLDAARSEITEDEMQRKLERLKETTGKIFAYVESRPEKLPETRKFISYYLPTTLKMIDKYCHFEEADGSLSDVARTREEIKNSMDTINSAFNNLLAGLYREDTMDVSTDIEVLHTMLEQEGLTGTKFQIEDAQNAAQASREDDFPKT